MIPRTVVGLCALALVGGALTAGTILSSTAPGASSTTSMPTASTGSTDCCEFPATKADILCIINIAHANVEGSNICAKHAGASSKETTTTTISKDGDDGGDGGDGGNGGDDGHDDHGDGGDSSETTITNVENEECDAKGLVNVQACQVVDDSFNDNTILSENDAQVVRDVLNDLTVERNDVDVVEDILENVNVERNDVVEDLVEDNEATVLVEDTLQTVVGIAGLG